MIKFIRFFNRFTTGVTLAAILVSAVFVVPGLAGIRPYIVRSGSMEPVIHTGSVAFINHRNKEPQPGDIVTYRLAGPSGQETLVTHRVVRVRGGIYTTRGDANQTEDLAPVFRKQLVGTYLYQIPYAGYLMAGMNRKTALAVLVWLVFLNGSSMAMGWASKDPSPRNLP